LPFDFGITANAGFFLAAREGKANQGEMNDWIFHSENV
jgi:hypothetical protein